MTNDKPHGPVSERFMRHHYGPSGYVNAQEDAAWLELSANVADVLNGSCPHDSMTFRGSIIHQLWERLTAAIRERDEAQRLYQAGITHWNPVFELVLKRTEHAEAELAAVQGRLEQSRQNNKAAELKHELELAAAIRERDEARQEILRLRSFIRDPI